MSNCTVSLGVSAAGITMSEGLALLLPFAPGRAAAGKVSEGLALLVSPALDIAGGCCSKAMPQRVRTPEPSRAKSLPSAGLSHKHSIPEGRLQKQNLCQ